MKMPRRPRLTYIFTVAQNASVIRGSVDYLTRHGYMVDVIASPGAQLEELRQEGAQVFPIEMRRRPSPLHDCKSMWKLYLTLRNIRPDIVNVGSPKAGLIGGVVAAILGVPHRIYTLHGLRLETARGPKRTLLWCAEWIACQCAHRVLCVSEELLDRARVLKLVSPRSSFVLGAGSLNGVEPEGYLTTPASLRAASSLRNTLGIEADAIVIGFVGRLTFDKGIQELYEAFARLGEEFVNLRLLLVGGYEKDDPVQEHTRLLIHRDKRVIQPGWINDVRQFYQVMDVFAFPSHREGLPTVLLEAQASSLPLAAVSATGVSNAMIRGVTGFITSIGDVPALTASLATLLRDEGLRRDMGEAGRMWVTQNFASKVVWQRVEAEYRRMLELDSYASGAPDQSHEWSQTLRS